ncbi:MAG: aminopeptidase [Spirochaetales bacterium]|nr:aminopeptidase [Spirochaetales bacterium]
MNKFLFSSLIAVLFLSAFTGCYYINEGTQLFSIYGQAQEIDKLLESGDLSKEEKELLLLVKEIKHFAVKKLGLKENRNYTTYVKIDKDYLADVVSACASDSFTQYNWFYLFMGDMPYMGFFKKEDAVAEVNRLKNEGYDVFAREVDAFSTLGVFSDPIFSYMKDYSLFSIASMLIHEQTHATLFLNQYVNFNENLASFTGDQGALIFIEDKYGAESEEYRKSVAEMEDFEVFTRLLKELYEELDVVYKSGITKEEKLKEKKRIIEDWKKSYKERFSENFKTQRYERIPEMPINNALLCTIMNYTDNSKVFYDLYHTQGDDLIKTFAIIKDLASQGTDPIPLMKEYIARQ